MDAVGSSGPSEYITASRCRDPKEDQLIKPFSMHLYKD
jgi:hypothetical protein